MSIFRLLPLLPLLPGCVVLKIHEGSGVSATQSCDVGPFEGLSNQSELRVVVTEGEPSVQISCDDNLIEDVQVVVDAGILQIWVESPEGSAVILRNHVPCELSVVGRDLSTIQLSGSGEVEATAPSLSGVVLSGSGSIRLLGETGGSQLEVALSGSGDLVADSIVVEELSMAVTGSGRVEVRGGSAGSLAMVNTGSGEALLRELQATHADVTLSGSGDADLNATGSIEAVVTGSGNLRIWGDPAIREVTQTGSGSVSFEE